MADGTTNTYSPALQQVLGGTPGQPGVYGTGLGFSQSDIAALQQAGISMSDLQSLNLVGSPQTMVGPGQAQYSPQQQQNAALVRMIMKLGGGGGQQQGGPPTPGNAYGQAYPLYATDAQGNPTGKPVYANPTNQASLLGAAALQMPAVINPPPSGTPSSKSGVAPTGGALIGSTVPQVGGWTWDKLKPAFGMNDQDVSIFQKQGLNPQQVADKLNSQWNPITKNALLQSGQFQPRDLAAFQAQGLTPQQVGTKFGVQSGLPAPTGTPGMQGPWANAQIGSVFTPVTPTAPTMALGATPLQAAGQPTAIAYNPTPTPFAQAPPAPGLQIPQSPIIAAHTSGLADAGRALFAHFGGDPNSATHADIANFHSQLTSALSAAPQATAAKKMASGGFVTEDKQKQSRPPANLLGTRPIGRIPPPNPMAVAGLPGNLPGISGGVPAFGSAYGTPPPITLPPWQGGQAGTGTAVAGQAGLPPANIIGTTPSGPIPPPNPQAVAGLPGNLPGISGGPPVFGSAYGTPPPITLPPWQGTKQMQAGGVVPGRGNEDTVPALLTPGEYVIPRPQVQQLIRTGRLPIKMADGGTVPDSDQNAPSEARRKTLTTPTAQSSSSSSAPAAPTAPTVPAGSHLASGLVSAAQTYANRVGGGGGIPAGSTAGAGAYGTVGSLMAGQGSAGAAGSLGQLPAGGGVGSALGGIGSGLTQAAQAIASSVKPWQMQSYQQPFGSGVAQAPPAPQFTQQQIPQQRQGSGSPYIAYATNPASPYGT